MYRKALKTIHGMTGGAKQNSDDQLLHFNSNLYDITESFYKTYADISGNAMKGGACKKSKTDIKTDCCKTGCDKSDFGALEEHMHKMEEEFKKRIEKLEEEVYELREKSNSKTRGGETEPTEEPTEDLENIKSIGETAEDVQKEIEDTEDTETEETEESESENEDTEDDDDESVENDLNNLSMQGGSDLETMLSKLGNKYTDSFKNKSALKGGNYGETKEMNKMFPY